MPVKNKIFALVLDTLNIILEKKNIYSTTLRTYTLTIFKNNIQENIKTFEFLKIKFNFNRQNFFVDPLFSRLKNSSIFFLLVELKFCFFHKSF